MIKCSKLRCFSAANLCDEKSAVRARSPRVLLSIFEAIAAALRNQLTAGKLPSDICTEITELLLYC